MEKRIKTEKEIWDEKSRFSFDELLKPYSEGGTRNAPVKRTIGTMVDYFLLQIQMRRY